MSASHGELSSVSNEVEHVDEASESCEGRWLNRLEGDCVTLLVAVIGVIGDEAVRLCSESTFPLTRAMGERRLEEGECLLEVGECLLDEGECLLDFGECPIDDVERQVPMSEIL